MRANSAAGRIVGALARTTPETPFCPGVGLRHNSIAGRIIGALARSETPKYLPKYDAYLAKELDYRYSSLHRVTDWLHLFHITSAPRRQKLKAASVNLLELLIRIPWLVWRLWMLPAGYNRYVRKALYLLRLAIPTGAVVLLCLDLATKTDVGPAFSTLLAFAIILQLIVTSLRMRSPFPIILFCAAVLIFIQMIILSITPGATAIGWAFSWPGMHFSSIIAGAHHSRTITHKLYLSWDLIFLVCSLPTALITRGRWKRRSLRNSSSIVRSRRAAKSKHETH
jgi:hypothetical protein